MPRFPHTVLLRGALPDSRPILVNRSAGPGAGCWASCSRVSRWTDRARSLRPCFVSVEAINVTLTVVLTTSKPESYSIAVVPASTVTMGTATSAITITVGTTPSTITTGSTVPGLDILLVVL